MPRPHEETRVKIGISTCLLGENVRYDGGHKKDRFITGTLSNYFEFVPVCPEVAIGLGVPREPIRLVGTPDRMRVVGANDPALDVTDRLRAYGGRMARELDAISGYILKSRSPSCGMERVKLYPPDADGSPSNAGVGQYAQALMQHRPDLPVEEDGRLNDPVLRENFIERVFTYQRWQSLQGGGVTASRLVDFHTDHKFALLAHDQAGYRALGKLVADAGDGRIEDVAEQYIGRLMRSLKKPATRKNHTNVLQHIQGYLKTELDADDKAELVEVLGQYRLGRLPLIVPITLLRHHFRRCPDPYISRQTYMSPHPPELMLRNLI